MGMSIIPPEMLQALIESMLEQQYGPAWRSKLSMIDRARNIDMPAEKATRDEQNMFGGIGPLDRPHTDRSLLPSVYNQQIYELQMLNRKIKEREALEALRGKPRQ